MVRQLLMLEPRARPTVDEIFTMKVVEEHLNLIPNTKHTARVPKKVKEHLDLRNTIGTPRRMGDLCHFLPHHTQYDEDYDQKPVRRSEKEPREGQPKGHREQQ